MEALERRGKLLAGAAIVLIVFWSQCKGVEGRNSTKMSYVCPPQFIRLGHSCYYFSDIKATWQNALFSCKDRDSNLTVPARWEDRNLRNYLNKPDIPKYSRWIGGIYDYASHAWKWGGELKEMRYQSFSKMKKLSPEELQWHCIAMVPELLYRWSPRSCTEPRQYICQTKLRKVPKSKLKDFRRKWQKMGNINEINAPGESHEMHDPRVNDVKADHAAGLKSYDLKPVRPAPKNSRISGRSARPSDLIQMSRPMQRRLTRPFPGYTWNRRDPEGSFKRNMNLLHSGKTGLSPQQIKIHTARLQHMRDIQVARRRRMKPQNHGDWLVNDAPQPTRPVLQTHARTYTIDNNISALHPKTIVEEFDMFPPPPSVIVPARPARGVVIRG